MRGRGRSMVTGGLGTRLSGGTSRDRGRSAKAWARPGVAAGLAAAMLGVALMVAAPSVGTAGAATSKITVTQTPGINQGPCISQGQLGYTVLSDSSIFRLRIFASSAPCSPIAATAAIYKMPGGGEAWPQTLAEV